MSGTAFLVVLLLPLVYSRHFPSEILHLQPLSDSVAAAIAKDSVGQLVSSGSLDFTDTRLIELALEHDSSSVLDYILEKGSDVNALGAWSHDPVVFKLVSARKRFLRDSRTLPIMIGHGVNLNVVSHISGLSPLALAIVDSSGNSRMVKSFVSSPGLDLNTHFQEEMYTVVMLAIIYKRLSYLKMLLAAGADLSAVSAPITPLGRKTALLIALETGYIEAAELIIPVLSPSIIDYYDSSAQEGVTALMLAARLRNFKIMKQLLVAGADCDIIAGAAPHNVYGYDSVGEAILMAGGHFAHTTLLQHAGRTALSYALLALESKLLQLLLDFHASLNYRHSAQVGSSTLLYTINNPGVYSNEKIFQVLSRTDIEGTNSDIIRPNNSPLFAAQQVSNFQVFSALIDRGVTIDPRITTLAMVRYDYRYISKLIDANADMAVVAPNNRNTPLSFLLKRYLSDQTNIFERRVLLVIIKRLIRMPDHRHINMPIPTPSIFLILDNSKLLQLFVNNGADLNIRNDQGNTPLIHAIKRGYSTSVTRSLLIAGADNNGFDIDSDMSVLALSAVHGIRPDHFDEILKYGRLELERKSMSGKTPLLQVLSYAPDARNYMPDLYIIRMMIAKGCSLDAIDDRGFSALYYAMIRSEYKSELSNFLISKGAPIVMQDGSQFKFVLPGGHYCGILIKYMSFADASSGSIKAFRQLISLGADINDIDSGGRTPLMYASLLGCGVFFDLLLQAGADTSLCSFRYSRYPSNAVLLASGCVSRDGVKPGMLGRALTPLMDAVITSKPYPLPIDNINQRDPFLGNTALMYAVQRNNLSAVTVLVEAGASLGVLNKAGSSVLIEAVKRDFYEMSELLIKLAARATVVTLSPPVRLTLSQFIRHVGVLSVGGTGYSPVEYRSHFRKFLNHVDSSGRTVWHYALRQCAPRMLSLLMLHRVDILAGFKAASSPLHVTDSNTNMLIALATIESIRSRMPSDNAN